MKAGWNTEPGVSFHVDKEKEALQAYAARILEELRKKTAERIPAVSQILPLFPFTPVREEIEFETDGTRIYYSPAIVVKTARQGGEKQLWYRYLHILAHGLLGHFQISGEHPKDSLLHAMMDIEAAEFLEQLGAGNPALRERKSMPLGWWMQRPNENWEGILSRYRKAQKDSEEKRRIYARAKRLREDHYEYWNQKKPFCCLQNGQKDSGAGTSDVLWRQILCLISGNGSVSGGQLLRLLSVKGQKSRWYGNAPVDCELVVAAKGQARLDYRRELGRYFRMQESKREQADTIDKALYTLGLELYENVMLIEPEEMAEQKLVHTIILAIDTSGSCMGEVLEQFLAETEALFSVLSENTFHRFILLQCDAGIQKIQEYRKPSDFPKAKEFRDGMQLTGFGGTSFVPVFDYVDRLVRKKEQVDCLIYLTDGFGTFPKEKKRSYETFFVLSGQEQIFGSSPDIPGWIKTVYLKQEEHTYGK